MNEILQIEKVDARIGYKLLSPGLDGPVEAARICFVDGAWRMKGAVNWFAIEATTLPGSLRAWKADQGNIVQFWACCGDACRPEAVRRWQDSLQRAGGQISHGYCANCAAEFLKG